jgi:hypothetical protein
VAARLRLADEGEATKLNKFALSASLLKIKKSAYFFRRFNNFWNQEKEK